MPTLCSLSGESKCAWRILFWFARFTAYSVPQNMSPVKKDYVFAITVWIRKYECFGIEKLWWFMLVIFVWTLVISRIQSMCLCVFYRLSRVTRLKSSKNIILKLISASEQPANHFVIRRFLNWNFTPNNTIYT